MTIDLAISPCPNDTFIFANLRNTQIGGKSVQIHFADVEELNRRALQEKRHILTKLSYFAALHLEDQYTILSCGGALGQGCGPLLLSKNKNNSLGPGSRIYIPGFWTTARLLLELYLNHSGLAEVELIPLRYDQIMPTLVKEENSFGVIIHEDRFTYPKLGLECLVDLGKWWEDLTGDLIPLGCIALRNDHLNLREEVETSIRKSLSAARQSTTSIWPYIKEHSQAMEDDVVQSHIDLYVNEFSYDIGPKGKSAISKLKEMARPILDQGDKIPFA